MFSTTCQTPLGQLGKRCSIHLRYRRTFCVFKDFAELKATTEAPWCPYRVRPVGLGKVLSRGKEPQNQEISSRPDWDSGPFG